MLRERALAQGGLGSTLVLQLVRDAACSEGQLAGHLGAMLPQGSVQRGRQAHQSTVPLH